jgi:hypothetical protein
MFPNDALTLTGSFIPLNGNSYAAGWYATTTLFSTSTPYTILRFQLVDNNDILTNSPGAVSSLTLSGQCGNTVLVRYRTEISPTISSYVMTGNAFDGHYVCAGTSTYAVIFSGDTFHARYLTWNMTYLPYNLASSSSVSSMTTVDFTQLDFGIAFGLAFVALFFLVWFFRKKT